MAKFSRSDIRNFFRDTITEMYDDYEAPRVMFNPETGEETNIDIMRYDDVMNDEPSAPEIRRATRRGRAMNPSSAVDVHMPAEDEFDNMTALRKLRRSQIREMIEEAMKVSYGDGHSETYDDFGGMEDDDDRLEYMRDMPYAVDDDESLSAMPGRADMDLDSLSADDELGTAEGRLNAFGDLFLMSIEHPERVMPEIQSRADAAGMAPFDFLVSQGMSRIAASNIMAALGKFDQAPEGMTFG